MEAADVTILAESSEKKPENQPKKKKKKKKYIPRGQLTEEERLRERAKARQRRNSLPEEKKRQMYEQQRQNPERCRQNLANFRIRNKQRLLEQQRNQSPEFVQEQSVKREIRNARMRQYYTEHKEKLNESRRQSWAITYHRDKVEINERKRLRRAKRTEEKRKAKALQCLPEHLKEHWKSVNEIQFSKWANLTEVPVEMESIECPERTVKVEVDADGGQSQQLLEVRVKEEPKEVGVEMDARDDAFESSREYDIVVPKVEPPEYDDRIDTPGDEYAFPVCVNGTGIVEIKKENTLSDEGRMTFFYRPTSENT